MASPSDWTAENPYAPPAARLDASTHVADARTAIPQSVLRVLCEMRRYVAIVGVLAISSAALGIFQIVGAVVNAGGDPNLASIGVGMALIAAIPTAGLGVLCLQFDGRLGAFVRSHKTEDFKRALRMQKAICRFSAIVSALTVVGVIILARAAIVTYVL